ncbi:MAG: type II toxin-antitoxin system VapC family toxin [Leptolyngbyaceae cyanobacterium CAN_BIN12]|nr:type II toxin-antitoxin system VapC family toxin [Leptolyngbyaceae cyanobacterium CAN_BIN12]
MSGYLLDTHVLLWFVEADPRLSDRAKDLLTNDDTNLSVSIVSLWEIVIKLNIGKLKIDYTTGDIYQLLDQLHVEVLPIEHTNLDCYLTLPLHHRDPFDRVLIAQAMNRRLALVSADQALHPYEVEQLW